MRRRRSYGGLGSTRRTRKVRPPIRVRPIVAKKGGRCTGCRMRYEVGDPITVVKMKRRVFHTASCVPPNIDQVATLMGTGTQSATPVMPKTAGEAAMLALVHLENAMVLRAKSFGISPEMEKAFEKYTKLKGMALRPGSPTEGQQAMKLATIELVKLVFANQ